MPNQECNISWPREMFFINGRRITCLPSRVNVGIPNPVGMMFSTSDSHMQRVDRGRVVAAYDSMKFRNNLSLDIRFSAETRARGFFRFVLPGVPGSSSTCGVLNVPAVFDGEASHFASFVFVQGTCFRCGCGRSLQQYTKDG